MKLDRSPLTGGSSWRRSLAGRGVDDGGLSWPELVGREELTRRSTGLICYDKHACNIEIIPRISGDLQASVRFSSGRRVIAQSFVAVVTWTSSFPHLGRTVVLARVLV